MIIENGYEEIIKEVLKKPSKEETDEIRDVPVNTKASHIDEILTLKKLFMLRHEGETSRLL